MANTYTKIASATIGSGGAANIDFTSIPATYTDLKLVVSGRSDASGTTGILTFNNDTTSGNYSYKQLYGTGAAAGSTGGTGYYPWQVNRSTATASTFGSTEIYIPNYLSANYKSLSSDSLNESNEATNVNANLFAGLWSSTAAITQITISCNGGNFVQYSSATLYGIKNS